MIRHMPKTFEYLVNDLEAIDLQGFTKIADNTFPNIIAMITGKSREELALENCPDKNTTVFDNCTLIWNQYADRGYTTIFGEDAIWMGTFRYSYKGFVNQPTDYYLHPSFIVSESRISHRGDHGYLDGKICQGNKLTTRVLYDYIIRATEVLDDRPFFGHFHIAALTHDYISFTSAADQPSLEFLQHLKTSKTLENTILFFLSDHGQRWGDLRHTFIGFIEERMPYHMIVFPDRFKKRYRTAWKNLLINQNRLTSNYDIYKTMKSILNQDFESQSNDILEKESHGQSLFKVVPETRTCLDCHIPEYFCVCENSVSVKTDNYELNQSANAIIEKLNEKLHDFTMCAKLQLNQVSINVFTSL